MATTEMETRISELEKALCERIAKLEEQVSHLTRQVGAAPVSAEPAWWKKIVGVYKDDPEFDEAMRLGREYRESLRPKDEDTPETA